LALIFGFDFQVQFSGSIFGFNFRVQFSVLIWILGFMVLNVGPFL